MPRSHAALDLNRLAWAEWKDPETWPDGPVVYTLADDDGVFYVEGQSANVEQRMSAHRARRAFGHRARYMRAVQVSSPGEALRLERLLIFLFDPENCQHRVKRGA